MKKYPQLENGQVALLRIEKSTGIVLDDQFKADISIDQKRFTAFKNLADAHKYIERSSRSDIEFLIYDKDETLLEHINK